MALAALSIEQYLLTALINSVFMRCQRGVRRGLFCLEKILVYISQEFYQQTAALRTKSQWVLLKLPFFLLQIIRERLEVG